MLRYLDALRKRNSRALEADFAAIISDFAATALGGCIQSPGLYE